MVWKLSSSFRKLLLPPKSSFEKREKKSEKETLRDWIFTPAFNSFSSNVLTTIRSRGNFHFSPPPWKTEKPRPNLFRFAWLKIIAEEKSKKKKKSEQNRSRYLERMNWREEKVKNAHVSTKAGLLPLLVSPLAAKRGCTRPKFRVSI